MSAHSTLTTASSASYVPSPPPPSHSSLATAVPVCHLLGQAGSLTDDRACVRTDRNAGGSGKEAVPRLSEPSLPAARSRAARYAAPITHTRSVLLCRARGMIGRWRAAALIDAARVRGLIIVRPWWW
jgi:hypothetical protein